MTTGNNSRRSAPSPIMFTRWRRRSGRCFWMRRSGQNHALGAVGLWQETAERSPLQAAFDVDFVCSAPLVPTWRQVPYWRLTRFFSTTLASCRLTANNRCGGICVPEISFGYFGLRFIGISSCIRHLLKIDAIRRTIARRAAMFH